MTQMLRWSGIGLMGVAVILLIAAFLPKAEPEGGLNFRLVAKERVISGVYKVYGAKNRIVPMWLAKSVFHNSSGDRLTKLRVRYRVPGYSDWCSWHRYAAVDPGQTVVDLYYPIFTDACAKLTSRAPAELQMEYEYTDAKGAVQQHSENRPLMMLSRHEFIFSDMTAEELTGAFQDECDYAPLGAAWVSQGDDAVARLASIANKKAGGAGASTDFDSCYKVMRELYKIMGAIHISYQHPAALVDPNMSYDMKTVQSLQYPRDTIQKRSGTCIDLAFLYAAMMNSVGIHPFLVFMDGHCFPMGLAPNNRFIPVETTGVRDGYKEVLPFDKVVEIGLKNWKNLRNNGRYILVDVQKCWVNGISNPELGPLPPDILEKWGIMSLVDASVEQRRAAPTPAASVSNSRWAYFMRNKDGQASNGQMSVSGSPDDLLMVATAAYSLRGADALTYYFTEEFTFKGKLSGRDLAAQARSGTVTMNRKQIPPQGLPFNLNLMVATDGQSMMGEFSNAKNQKADIYLQRRQ
ncbi:MAG: transglutaminase-like domain-containing protein [Desulfobaccales bacterium]